jgi:phytoene dehydrogenase-like protein
MNEIAVKLGEVGLPAPPSELAAREWDAVVVGGGHNGLTAAGYLARAGSSVLVLERRERLGGAYTLERPFPDERFVISPCAYVVGLPDELVISELELRRRGFQCYVADPNLWVPFDDGTSFGQWLDDGRTQANLEALGVAPRAGRELAGARHDRRHRRPGGRSARLRGLRARRARRRLRRGLHPDRL